MIPYEDYLNLFQTVALLLVEWLSVFEGKKIIFIVAVLEIMEEMRNEKKRPDILKENGR